MPYEISWYIEDHVIANRYYGNITSEELTANREAVEKLIAAGQHPVMLVIDMRDVAQFPLDFKNIVQGFSGTRSGNQLTWALVLSDNRLLNFFGALVSKVSQVPMRSFHTLDEVDDFIAHNAPQLASEIPAVKST